MLNAKQHRAPDAMAMCPVCSRSFRSDCMHQTRFACSSTCQERMRAKLGLGRHAAVKRGVA